jgi:uncharacterized membrane protein YjgN (DUF898 family)
MNDIMPPPLPPPFWPPLPPPVPPLPPAALPPPVPDAVEPLPLPPAAVRFTGTTRAFRKLIVRGALLQIVSAGIYRFWLTTDARRFLWVNTEIGGDSLEYTGTAMELFLGFLMAVALLVPVYVLLFLGTLELGVVSRLSSSAAFLVLAVFGQYAYYRARRYRLTRTVFRGIRFHQSGSPWSYALRSLLWWIAIACSLGLAYPWAQASLERYKLAHTHYGELTGRFTATGTALFLRGVALWLFALVVTIAFFGLIGYFAQKGVRFGPTDQNTPQVRAAAAIVGGVAFAGLPLALIVYATLQAIMMKWWLAGLRFGLLEVRTTLRKRSIFGAYFRCIAYIVLVLVALSIIFGIVVAVGAAIVKAKPSPENMQNLTLAGVACVYLLLAVCGWIIYQMTIKLRIWRVAVDAITVPGFDAIAQVRADDSLPSSAVGEGLADALGAGGI